MFLKDLSFEIEPLDFLTYHSLYDFTILKQTGLDPLTRTLQCHETEKLLYHKHH